MAALFRGEYRHTLDPKGRLIMPLEYREKLGERFFIVRGAGDKYLNAYPESEWEKIEEKIEATPDLTSEAGKILHRYFIAGSNQCQPDNQGRVMIQTALRDYACLTKDVVLAGVGDHIEIWNPEKWEEKMNQMMSVNLEELINEQNWEQI